MREDWREVSLGDVVEINPESVRGWDEGKQIRYVEISCVSTEMGIDLTEVNTFKLGDAPSRAKRVIRSDDVLVLNVRPNLRKLALVPPDLDGEVATTGFTVLRAKQEALSRYIWAVIRSTKFTEHLVARVTGSTYPAIKAADVKDYTFSLPPPHEQRRIVDLIESVLPSIDTYIDALESHAEVVQAIGQVLLSELLRPPDMRNEWREVTLGDVVDIVSGGTPSTKVPEYWGGDIVWVTPTEVVANNGRYIYDSTRKITQESLTNSSAKMLPIDTVLLTSDASIGAVALSGVPMATATGFKSLVCGPDILPRFAMYWCQAHTREFLSRSVGSTILHLYKKALAAIPMNLPPIEEQQRIVDLIESFLESAGSYSAALEEQTKAIPTLRQALLAELLTPPPRDEWRQVAIGDCCHIQQGKTLALKDIKGGDHPVYGANGTVGWHSDGNIDIPTVALGCRGSCGTVNIAPAGSWFGNNVMGLVPKGKDLSIEFVALLLEKADLRGAGVIQGQVQDQITRKSLSPLQVDIPPIEEQQRIVELIAGMNEVTEEVLQANDSAISSAHTLRAGVLTSLLSGEHEIPDSFNTQVESV